MEMFQRALLSAVMVTIVSGFRDLSTDSKLSSHWDGLAHVSFGGRSIGIVLGASSPPSVCTFIQYHI